MLQDPIGNAFHISVEKKSSRPCLTDGLQQIRAFYQIHFPVYLWYKYIGNGSFTFTIWKTAGQGQIDYPIPNEVNGDGNETNESNVIHNEEQNVPYNPLEVLAVLGKLLWVSQIMRNELRAGRGLIVPARVIKSYLRDRPKHIAVRLPNQLVQTWKLTWNSKENGRCLIVRPWFKLRDQEKLKEGDMLRFWKLEGEYCIQIFLTRYNA
ncbi:DNA-binding barrel domain superfamily [Sesbania bispinosa]|nr:DNA-binding barrel domain superfamily [Sesbania bispinosa]